MPGTDQAAAARRLQLALEMFELGEARMRERLRRKHPHASETELEAHLTNWLRTRPGAEHGDAWGVPIGERRRPR